MVYIRSRNRSRNRKPNLITDLSGTGTVKIVTVPQHCLSDQYLGTSYPRFWMYGICRFIMKIQLIIVIKLLAHCLIAFLTLCCYFYKF